MKQETALRLGAQALFAHSVELDNQGMQGDAVQLRSAASTLIDLADTEAEKKAED